MKQKLSLLVVCMLALLPIWAIGQEGALIQGVVTSERGDPLPGASVFLQYTTYGAATDPNGAFSIRVPQAIATGQQMDLVAKYIGYRSKTAKIRLTSGTITQNFTLAEDVLALEAVVVTGLGETVKENSGSPLRKSIRN